MSRRSYLLRALVLLALMLGAHAPVAMRSVWGATDNASFEIQNAEPFAFVVISDPRTSSHQTGVRQDLQQIEEWVANPTPAMPAPRFMVIVGDFDHTTDTEAAIDEVLGTDFLWFPVIGNHEIDVIGDFYYVRDTMFPSLPWIADSGPAGSVGTSYSWEYGNAHFVAVNCYWDGTTGPGADHATDCDIPLQLRNWIDADLASSGQPHEFVFVHEPAYPEVRHVGDSLDQYPANRDAFVTMLDANGVEVLFVGHDHYYHHDVASEHPLLGSVHQIDSGQLQGPGSGGDGSTIIYVLVDGTTTTYKAYRSTVGSPFTLHEQWTVNGEPPTDPPDAPSNLSAAAISAARIDLAWTDNADNESNFQIERSTTGSGGPFNLLATVPANTTAYANTGLDPETEYCYRVRAINSVGNSGYTNVACATTLEQPPVVGVCEDFESGYTLGAELRTHPDWFYEDANSGPRPTAGIGVGGSIGLSGGDRVFTWVAHPLDWNAPDFTGVSVWMDFQTDASGHFDDDRVGWMISSTDDDSGNIFGVQMDPGSSGYNIEGYWDGVSSLDRRPSIVDLPSLSPNTWYRFSAEITKRTATSASIDVTLTQLDAGGSPVGPPVASGSIDDTSTLGDDAPNAKYFTASTIWPAYKNYTTAAAPADNACFDLGGSPPMQYALTVNVIGSGLVTKNPDQALYGLGEVVQLTAFPAVGWAFGGWSGDLGGNANPTEVTITGDMVVTASFFEQPSAGLVCEDFESGYTLGAELRVHPDWFYETWASGPKPTAGIGVAGSIGLSEADRPFTWVAHPFYWNAPDFLGTSLAMDFQTDGSGQFKEDRVGWVVSNTSCGDPFAVQLYPGGTSHVIQGYWDGVGGPDRTPTIVQVPPLSANTWYRLGADMARLTPTSTRIDVSLTRLDASGYPAAVVATGSVPDTSLLGDSAPLSKYFTGALWPAFKNYNAVVGAADNACFELIPVPGSISIVKEADPEGDQSFEFSGDLGDFSLTDDGSAASEATFQGLTPGAYAISEAIPVGWELTSLVCSDPSGGTTTDLGTATALADLAPGDDITCIFADTELGSITIVKQAEPEGDQSFEFSGDLGDFSLTDDGTAANTTTFEGLTPATYAVSEMMPGGSDLISIVCSDPTGGTTIDLGAATALIDLTPGDEVTCTFTNQTPGTPPEFLVYLPLVFRNWP